MDINLKAALKTKMQEFLDDNADDIGSMHGIWQDNTEIGRNALLMTNAAEVVIDSMELQSTLETELNG